MVVNWYKEKRLEEGILLLVASYFLIFREFMKSKSQKDFAIITNVNAKFLNERKIEKSDKRIKFVGTVYDN